MKPLRVLLVEDESVIAALFAEVLAVMGHDVCAIESTVASAVAAAERCKPDMMIVDGRLGSGCGVSAVETIQHSMGFIPHVYVSGDAMRIRRMRPRAVVIQKPFFVVELVRAMQLAVVANH